MTVNAADTQATPPVSRPGRKGGKVRGIFERPKGSEVMSGKPWSA